MKEQTQWKTSSKLIFKASLYQMILLALSIIKKSHHIKQIAILNDRNESGKHWKESKSSKKEWSLLNPLTSVTVDQVESLIGVPGFIQKRCSPGCSCCFLGTHMQMSSVVALILSSLCRADILPGTETAQCCVRMLSGRAEGEEYRGGPRSSHSRLNEFPQPITAWIHQL